LERELAVIAPETAIGVFRILECKLGPPDKDNELTVHKLTVLYVDLGIALGRQVSDLPIFLQMLLVTQIQEIDEPLRVHDQPFIPPLN